MKFVTGPNHAEHLTDEQILKQCKMYVAAVRIADDFGCHAIGIQYQQGLKDLLPASDLVEGFPRGGKQFIVAYCFEGRNAHQTLGMLLTKRMERMGLRPLDFVATDYVLGIWGLRPPTKAQLDALFDEDMLGDDLESWMDESSMLRRSFRNVAVIAGLIERRHPGEEKSRRQVTFSSDLIYDALRKHEPNHILLRATRQDAAPSSPTCNAWASCFGAPRAGSNIAASTASRRSPCRCCWRSAKSA